MLLPKNQLFGSLTRSDLQAITVSMELRNNGISNHGIEKTKPLEAIWELKARQHCQMGCLAGSFKTAPKILIAMGAEPSF